MITEHDYNRIVIRSYMRLKKEHETAYIKLRATAMRIVREIATEMNLEPNGEELERMAWDSLTNVTLSADVGISVTSSSIKDDLWLDKTNVKFEYFDRFIKYLKLRKHWIETETLEEDSYSIVQMLGDPKSNKELHRRGMLIGDVQLGKTTSYTAIMNRAVDVGYNVIVLLAGSLENLRRQTQERLDNELVGYTLSPQDKKTLEVVGVGEFSVKPRVQVQTSTLWDFTSRARKKIQSKIEDKTLVFIAKKNVKALETILEALKADNESLSKGKKLNASILVIDDEADNASVNTKANTNLDPTKINGRIRRLLDSFMRSSYLAVTATPFANIFIDDATESEMYGEDLFPSDFIYLLERPPAYTGAYKLFGYDSFPDDDFNYESCLIPVKKDEIPNTSYKFKHRKEDIIINNFNDLPVSLKSSIRYFLLVQYLMDFDPNVKSPHRTMMINVSRYVSVQNKMVEVITDWLNEILLPNLLQFHNYPEKAENKNAGEFHELKVVWDNYKLEKISCLSWEAVSVGLYDSVSKIRINAENMSRFAKDLGRLNYKNYPEGDRVITVGGQCLSRGLTLETLVVSYFYRNSAAYDTLLQMGRWFGYRNSYLQYFKIWIAEESILWYRLISEACEDLRLQVSKMMQLNTEPRYFGLMVRRHPAAGLVITARCKMRNAMVGRKQPVSLEGRLIETPRLWKDCERNHKNEKLILDFLKLFSHYSVLNDGLLIRDVQREDIVPFVAAFDSAILSIGFKINELSTYIENNTSEKWDIVIPQRVKKDRTNDIKIGEATVKINLIDSKFTDSDLLQDGNEFIRINDHHVRIGTGNVTKIGLSGSQIKELENRYNSHDRKKSWAAIKNTASIYLEAYKENSTEYRNPLLIIYPLSLKEKDGNKPFDKEHPITWALGIGFSGAKEEDKEKYFEYWLNPVAIRAGVGIDEDEEGDDELNDGKRE